jgi:hypothetical protein
MATVLNDRDVLIESLPRNTAPSQGRAFLLSANTPVFTVDSGGLGSPSTISLTTQLVNLTGTVSWSVTGATGLTISGDTLSATLAFSNVTASTITVQAQITYLGVTYLASQVLQKVTQGIQGESTAQAYAYKRLPTVPTDNPGAVTWTFASGSITTPSTDALANGWTKSIPTGTDPLYVVVASALGTGATAAIAASAWTAPAKLAQDGLAGLNVATVFIYQKSNSSSAPALPSVATTYTFSTGVLTGLNNGWSYGVPAGSQTYLYVSQSTASSNTTTANIPAPSWAAVQLLAQNGANGTNGSNGSNGANGTRGTVNVSQPGYSAWSDAAATALIQSFSGYGNPIQNDIVTLYSASFSQTRFYSGTYPSGSWGVLSAYINGNLLVSGTLAADKIQAATTLSGVNISGGTLNIANQLIVTSSGQVDAYSFFGHASNFGNLNNPTIPAIAASSTGSSAPTISVSPPSSATGIQVNSGGALGVSSTATTAIKGVGTTGAGGDFSTTSSGPALTVSAPSGNAINITGGANGIVQSGGGANWMRTMLSVTNAAYNLGASGNSFGQCWVTAGAFNTSDARTKTNIADSDKGLDFINALRPRSYTMIVGQRTVTDVPEQFGPWIDGVVPPTQIITERPGVRRHYGFLTQELKEALGPDNIAMWALADPNDPDSAQFMVYDELISPTVKAVQELHVIVQQQAAIIAQLQADVAKLKGP